MQAKSGGEGGIRTPETLPSLHALQACALNRARPPLRARGTHRSTPRAPAKVEYCTAMGPIPLGDISGKPQTTRKPKKLAEPDGRGGGSAEPAAPLTTAARLTPHQK